MARTSPPWLIGVLLAAACQPEPGAEQRRSRLRQVASEFAPAAEALRFGLAQGASAETIRAGVGGLPKKGQEALRLDYVEGPDRHALLIYSLRDGPPGARLEVLISGAVEVRGVRGTETLPPSGGGFEDENWRSGEGRWGQVAAVLPLLSTQSTRAEVEARLGPPDEVRLHPASGWALILDGDGGQFLYWPEGGYEDVFEGSVACGVFDLSRCKTRVEGSGWVHVRR
ncbi:MAG: hypothetical protein AAFU79_00920 [Myxococcota bacterium]